MSFEGMLAKGGDQDKLADYKNLWVHRRAQNGRRATARICIQSVDFADGIMNKAA